MKENIRFYSWGNLTPKYRVNFMKLSKNGKNLEESESICYLGAP